MKKRVLSFALVLVMCFALLPSAAFAATDWSKGPWSDLPFSGKILAKGL